MLDMIQTILEEAELLQQRVEIINNDIRKEIDKLKYNVEK